MKIFEVNALFPPEWWGGAEVYVLNLTRHLNKLGHDVFVVTGRRGEEESALYERLQYDFATVLRLPRLNAPLSISDARINELFLNLLIEIQPEVVHFHVFSDYLPASMIRIAKDEGLPIFQHLHDYWFLCPAGILSGELPAVCSGPESGDKCSDCPVTSFAREKLLQQGIDREFYSSLGRKIPDKVKNIFPVQLRRRLKKIRAITKSLCFSNTGPTKSLYNDDIISFFRHRNNALFSYLQQCDRLLCPSYFVCNKYIEWGIAKKYLSVCPLGLDLSIFSDFQREESRVLRFGYIGALTQIKGVHILIQSFRELNVQDVQLNIWGTGPPSFYKQLLNLACGDERIRFCGSLPNADITKAFQNIDILVAPSLWPETYGLVIREANATQTPVIASRIGAYEEAVKSGINGFLAEPGNIQQLAGFMKTLYKDRDLIKSMQQRIPLVRSIEEDALELASMYAEAIGNRKKHKS
jgi:glycosyltransferase involved in cell wall biosynthesis